MSMASAARAVVGAIQMAKEREEGSGTDGAPSTVHRPPLPGAAIAAVISGIALLYATAQATSSLTAADLLSLPGEAVTQLLHVYQTWPQILAFAAGIVAVLALNRACRALLLRLVFASELSDSPLDDLLVRLAIVFFPAPTQATDVHVELKRAAAHFGIDLSDDGSLASSSDDEDDFGGGGDSDDEADTDYEEASASAWSRARKDEAAAEAAARGRVALRSIFFAKAVDVATWPSTVEGHLALTAANLVLGACLGIFLSINVCSDDDDAGECAAVGVRGINVTRELLHAVASVALTMRLAVPMDHASTLLVSDFLAIGTAVGANGHRTFANVVSAFRILLWTFVTLIVVKILGGDVSAVIQGLGFLGFGFAFAMQKTLQDAIVALTLFWNKPFAVGDLIDIGSVGGATGCGYVRQVHLRYTTLQLLDSGQEMRVSNTDLANCRIQNFAHHTDRRVYQKVTVDLSATPEQLDKVPAMYKEAVSLHKEAEFAVACLMAMTPAGHVFEVIFTVHGTRLQEREIKHRVNLHVLAAMTREGIRLARRPLLLADDQYA